MLVMLSDIHKYVSVVEREIEKVGKENISMLISLGDDSLNYFGGHKDRKQKRALNDIGIPTLLIRGNHDKRPEYIKSFKEKVYKGGVVFYEEEYPNLNFAKTGEIYKLEDYTGEEQNVLVIGGGYSIDKYIRKELGIPYFKDEMPTEDEKARVLQQIREHKIDYILSHVAPLQYEPRELFLSHYEQSTVDKTLEKWLDKIYDEEGLDKLKRWYFGHYHGEKVIDNMRLVYHNLIEFGR